jgi:5-methyltetrahydrofolate--homocysteine methyltransferase
MTTTVDNMKITIDELRKNGISCSVMVGGAVLNKEYAEVIGADFYGKDANEAVSIARRVFQA